MREERNEKKCSENCELGIEKRNIFLGVFVVSLFSSPLLSNLLIHISLFSIHSDMSSCYPLFCLQRPH